MLALPFLLMAVGQAAALGAILLPVMTGVVLAFIAWWILRAFEPSPAILGVSTAAILAASLWFHQQFGLLLLGLAGGSLMYWTRARVFRAIGWAWAYLARWYRGRKLRKQRRQPPTPD